MRLGNKIRVQDVQKIVPIKTTLPFLWVKNSALGDRMNKEVTTLHLERSSDVRCLCVPENVKSQNWTKLIAAYSLPQGPTRNKFTLEKCSKIDLVNGCTTL